MTKLELLRAIREAMSDPARIGDVPVYKSELSKARARPEVEAQLGAVRGYAPKLDLDELARSPDGTLGREYARFLRANDLHPITLTGNCPPEMVELEDHLARPVSELRAELGVELAALGSHKN